MVETKTIESDKGKRCDHCGRDLYVCTQTWWLARHGEYCSKGCGEAGAGELERAIRDCRELADLALGKYDDEKTAEVWELKAIELEAKL